MPPIAARPFHLAQVNIGLPVAPVDTPALAEFMTLLDPVNAIADGAPGFVWRLQTEEGNATSIPVLGDDRLIVNMSVWESIDQLAEFVYRSGHVAVMRRRREWFERIKVFVALWWVPAGHRPAVTEAEERLEHLRAHGPTADAFTFRHRFPAPDALQAPELDGDLLACPG
ncbi:MAG: DUF3291 domain-containing protein [Solirubrobacteraceae bacterium]